MKKLKKKCNIIIYINDVLIQQLYVKYNIFAKVPPEFQLVLLVGTTAMLCKTKNDKKLELESFLNEPIKKEM